MFSHLTVPVDGSRFAESAIPYATSIARRTEGKVELVIVEEAGLPPRVIQRVRSGDLETTRGEEPHRSIGDGAASRRGVVEPPAAAGIGVPEPVVVPPPKHGETEPGGDRSPAARYVIDLAADTQRRSGASVEATVLAGRPIDALLEHIGHTGTSLVVMATHGRGAFSRFWLGGVADEMARTVSSPLLLIRPSEDEDAPVAEEIEIREILVPLDGSPHGEEVLTLAAPLAAAMGAHITLLRIAEIRMLAGSPFAPDMIQIDDVGLEAERAQSEQYLTAVAARLRHRGFTVRTAVAEGVAANDIIGYADEHDAHLIAMSTHGYGGLKRLLLGSVADKVMRGTHRPILLFRPTGG